MEYLTTLKALHIGATECTAPIRFARQRIIDLKPSREADERGCDKSVA